MNDLIERLEDLNLSKAEIVELLNDVLNDSNSQDELDDYARQNMICPKCYSDEFDEDYSFENGDADGNRKQMIKHYICRNCGNDLYED